jgi:hypothetical protein
MSSKTRSILKKDKSGKTKKNRVKIVPENNIELVFHKPFSSVDKPQLWHGKTERQLALRESQMEEINAIGKNTYLEKNKKRMESRKSHSSKILTEYKTRKNLPYLAANEARVKKITYDEDPGIIVLKRSRRYYGGRTKKGRR